MVCIVLEGMCKELGRPILIALATAVRITTAENSPINIEKYVDDMPNLGSRYINIEATVGCVICLILGCELPES
jgi:hypothetical protein